MYWLPHCCGARFLQRLNICYQFMAFLLSRSFQVFPFDCRFALNSNTIITIISLSFIMNFLLLLTNCSSACAHHHLTGVQRVWWFSLVFEVLLFLWTVQMSRKDNGGGFGGVRRVSAAGGQWCMSGCNSCAMSL